MSYDVAMRIGGTLKDAESARRLVKAVADSGMGYDWEAADFGDVAEALDFLKDGGRICLTGKDVEADMAAEIEEACREIGLTYKSSVGPAGEDGYDRTTAWAPGMEAPVSCLGEDGVSLDALDMAIGKGFEAVVSLRDEVRAAVDLEVPDLDPLAPEVADRLSSLEDGDWEAPLGPARAPRP